MKATWVIALFAIFCLSPYLTTGYYQDDSINCLLPTFLAAKHQTLTSFIIDSIRNWATHEARIFPIAVAVTYSLWYWIQDLLLYRALLVASVVLDLLLFGKLILALGGGRKLAVLSVLIALGLFQLRDFHDPIASYALLMQITLALGLGATLALVSFHAKSRSSTWLGLSAALYACSLLYYEIAFTFTPILLGLALLHPLASRKRRLVAFWSFASVTCFYLFVAACLRWMHPVQYAGLQSSFRLKAISTFIFQLSAALPMSYPIFGRSGFYTIGTLVSREFLTGGMLVVFCGALALLFGVLREPVVQRPTGTQKTIKLLGAALAALPALIIAISHKYQDQVTRPGVGYLPVYFSYFGVALLLGLWIQNSRRPRATACVLALLLAFTYSTNRIAADHLNRYWRYPRELFEHALRKGLIDSLPDGARLVLTPRYDWEGADFFQRNAGKRPSTLLAEDYPGDRPPGPMDYLLEIRTKGSSGGQVSLAAIRSFEKKTGDSPPDRFVTEPVTVFKE